MLPRLPQLKTRPKTCWNYEYWAHLQQSNNYFRSTVELEKQWRDQQKDLL